MRNFTFLFFFLISTTILVQAQSVHLRYGISNKLESSGDFKPGYLVSIGGELRISRTLGLQFVGEYFESPYNRTTLERQENSQVITYQVSGGDFSAKSFKTVVRIIPFPSWVLKPYFKFGIGFGQNTHNKRSTIPSGSVFERHEDIRRSLIRTIGFGVTFHVFRNIHLLIDNNLVTANEGFGGPIFYHFGSGLEFRFQ